MSDFHPPLKLPTSQPHTKRMRIFASIVSLMLLLAPDQARAVEPKEQVVILHGIARSSAHMEALAKFLEVQGYEVFNLDYPSTDHPLEELIDHVQMQIAEKADVSRPLHMVGYSMGGIVIRALLNKHRPENLGRVVQLASPNKGSEVADFIKDNWLYEKVYGPAGQQLTTDQTGLGGLLGTVDYELGVVAGNASIDPVSSAIIPGDDDGKVSVESTKVAGMKDHVVVSATHTFFPGNKTVQRQALEFLQNGKFKR